MPFGRCDDLALAQTSTGSLNGREQAIFAERDRKLSEARARSARKRQQEREEVTAA